MKVIVEYDDDICEFQYFKENDNGEKTEITIKEYESLKNGKGRPQRYKKRAKEIHIISLKKVA